MSEPGTKEYRKQGLAIASILSVAPSVGMAYDNLMEVHKRDYYIFS